MHSVLSIASLLLAASGALAAPSSAPADSEVRVVLQSQATETGVTTTFKNVNSRKTKPVGSDEMFETITIDVGAGAQQDLRCQALDTEGKPLIATRGENIVSLTPNRSVSVQFLTHLPGHHLLRRRQGCLDLQDS